MIGSIGGVARDRAVSCHRKTAGITYALVDWNDFRAMASYQLK